MLKKISKRKTIKVAAQVTTFVVVTAAMAAVYKEYIPAEYANKLVVRVGKAILYYTAVSSAINCVSETVEAAFDETNQ